MLNIAGCGVPNGYTIACPGNDGVIAVTITDKPVAFKPKVPQLVELPPWLAKLLALIPTKLRVAPAAIAPAAVLRVSTIRQAATGV
ncbi:MAG: hypothetical protein EAZ24_04000 [Burkholderiales bacterium]|nr:MAG: hypothetical protein EAZ24_04000 [Burkholderiales bacterium]TAG83217.1 MAG: hypothetical protein EAZ21_01965 [Betaproteobacteria bacterium]